MKYSKLMFYMAKVAVCSEIYIKVINKKFLGGKNSSVYEY